MKKITFFSTKKKVIVIITVGIAISVAVAAALNAFNIGSLTQRARGFAFSVDPETAIKLNDKKLPDSQVPYTQTKQKLADLKKVYSDTRFVYILARDSSGFYFTVDSEPAGSSGYSPRSDPYGEASDRLKAIFNTKESFTEGPVHDSYGDWYSALSPILDKNGKVVAVMGLDVPARNYLAGVIGTSLIPLLIATISAGAVIIYDRLRKKSLAALRFQSELISIASHELRSPLSGIRWGEEILMKGRLDDTERKMFGIMYDSTIRLQESIEDVLQLATIGAEKSDTLVFRQNNLSELLQDIVKTQGLFAQQKNVQLVFDAPWPEILTINCDGVKLKRVFNNIISNAIKYGLDNSAVSIAYQQKDGFHIISIKNKGIGVPKSEQKHIFDGFYRASNAVKSGAGGTGMGLYLSRSVVEQHGGNLWLTSTENVETIVYISLPVDKPINQTG